MFPFRATSNTFFRFVNILCILGCQVSSDLKTKLFILEDNERGLVVDTVINVFILR